LLAFNELLFSILGLTIDYGPFGFVEYYDPNFICNSSGNILIFCFTDVVSKIMMEGIRSRINHQFANGIWRS
jgi:hypothetical protein